MILGTWGQLHLCLWKHWKMKTRRPFSTLLQVTIPVFLVLALLMIRLVMPPSNQDICTFNARAGPSAGLLAMTQSYVCNLQNNCGPLDLFEEVPTYPGSQLQPFIRHLPSIIYNQTVLGVARSSPSFLPLLVSLSSPLSSPIFQRMIMNETVVADIFIDSESALSILSTSTMFSHTLASTLLKGRLLLGKLTGDLVSLLTICTKENFFKVLPIPEDDLTLKLEKILCNLSLEDIFFLLTELDWATLLTLGRSFNGMIIDAGMDGRVWRGAGQEWSDSVHYQDDFTKSKHNVDVVSVATNASSFNITLKSAFTNWDNVISIMTQHRVVSSSEVDRVSQLYVYVPPSLLLLLSSSCESLISRYVWMFPSLAPLNITEETIIGAVCNIEIETVEQLLTLVDRQAVMEYLKEVQNLSPTHLADQANMTEMEVYQTIRRLEEAVTIQDWVRDTVTSLIQDIDTYKIAAKLNITDWTQVTVDLLPSLMSYITCGTKLMPLHPVSTQSSSPSNSSYLPVSPLPNGCSYIYHSLLQWDSWLGGVVWRFLGPFLQGHVYFTPDNVITRSIIHIANKTFQDFSVFRNNSQALGNIYTYIKDIETYYNEATIITNFLSSDFYLELSQSNLNQTYNINLTQFEKQNLTTGVTWLSSLFPVLEGVRLVTDSLSCVNTNRFVPSKSELDIVNKSAEEDGNFLAGIIFMDNTSDPWSSLPPHLHYTIRMSVDSVPRSSELRERMWVPGPDGDMFYNMRYFWGFTQLQDLIDNAVIQIQSGEPPRDSVYLQQFPYPCFQRDNYLSGVYTVQLIQILLVFGYSVVTSLEVRQLIWEKESNNSLILQVMGINSVVMWIANFIVMFLIMFINSVLLTFTFFLGGLLPRSNPGFIFILLLNYGLSAISFIFLLTVIMRKSTSGAVASFLLFILTFLPFLILISLNEEAKLVFRVLSNLSMSTSFSFAFLYITRYEQQGVGLHWDTVSTSPIQGDPLSYVWCCLLLLLDSFLYTGLGLLIQVYPTWRNGTTESIRGKEGEMDATQRERGIVIRDLRKEYRLRGGGVRVAVEGLRVVFREGNITGLIGHNGAGKSTTIGMITGMVSPTNGSITINGIDTSSDWKYLKGIIGYCPQQSILYSILTVREHLSMYCWLKSGHSKCEKSVMEMMEAMGMKDKAEVQIGFLSEGLKRRLCVATAFIGGSTVIILDEPSCGVDPGNRKHIWKLIKNHKSERTILVTTHYIDEAEQLCDRVAILHRGRLQMEGSCRDIQGKFGDSCKLHISGGTYTHISSGEDLLDKQIKILVPMSRKTSQSYKQRTFSLPMMDDTNISQYNSLFSLLENKKTELNISWYSVSTPTLEDVLLSVVLEADSDYDNTIHSEEPPTQVCSKQNKDEWVAKHSGDTVVGSPSNESKKIETEMKPRYCDSFPLFFNQVLALLWKRWLNLLRDRRYLLCSLIIPSVLLVLAMATANIRPETRTPPLLLTPSMYGPNSVSFTSLSGGKDGQKILSALFAPPGIGTTCMPSLQSPVSFTPCHHKRGIQENKTVLFTEGTCSCQNEVWDCDTGTGTVDDSLTLSVVNSTDLVYSLPPSLSPNTWILDTHYSYLETRYGGWRTGVYTNNSLGTNTHNTVVYFNNKGFHSVAAYLNAVNNARMRSSLPLKYNRSMFGISTFSHPLRSTRNQVLGQTVVQHISDYTLALFMLTVVTFLPTTNIVFLIQERIRREKQVQKTFGVGTVTYWISALVFDSIVSLIFLIIASVIIQIFQIRSYTVKENFPACILLIFLFCLTSNTLVYLVEKAFTEPSMGQVILLTVYVFLGLLTLTVMLLLQMFWWIPVLRDIKHILEVVFLIFPPYSLGGGLLSLTTAQIQADLYDEFLAGSDSLPTSHQSSWTLLINNILFLIVEAVLCFTFHLVWETHRGSHGPRQGEGGGGGGEKRGMVTMEGVTKVYKSMWRSFRAVDNINLQLERGECLGLIGLNGAGKSTIFQMVTGALHPSNGSIHWGSHRLGYCPQTDSIDSYLTVREQLHVCSLLAGYSRAQCLSVAAEAMDNLGLNQYAEVLCGDLSGGNKRKVCVAVSLLGKPPIVLMDEPTSGLDPGSKRQVWTSVTSAVSRGQSVMLTSHNMAEVDSLCDRLAILVRGKVRVVGSPDQLKKSLGGGYKVSLRLSEGFSSESGSSVLSSFPKVVFMEEANKWLSYRVPASISSLLFQISLAKQCGVIQGFTVNMAPLDEVFIQVTGNLGLEVDTQSEQSLEEDLEDKDQKVAVSLVEESVNIQSGIFSVRNGNQLLCYEQSPVTESTYL